MSTELRASLSASLTEQVEQTILARMSGRIRDLRICFEGDRLIITGRTPTYYNKQLATHAAIDVAETAYSVQNEVQVC